MFPRKDSTPTIQVRNRVDTAFVSATINIECATHRDCFHVFQSYRQQDIGSGIEVKFCEGKV